MRPPSGRHECRPPRLPHVYHTPLTRTAGISLLATGDMNVAPTHMPDNHGHANPHTTHKPPPHVGAPLVTPGRPQGGNATACMRPPPGRHECRPYVYPTCIPSRAAGISPPPPGRHECRPYVYPTFITSHTATANRHPHANPQTTHKPPLTRRGATCDARPTAGRQRNRRMHASATRAT